MSTLFDLSTFKSLHVPEKINYLRGDFINSIKDHDDKIIISVMHQIILDESENSYIRKITLELFIDFVIIGKLKKRHALNLLLDNWKFSSEVFLELQRLKDLYLFYEYEKDEIESIYLKSIKNHEPELKSESGYNLGLIYFKKALEVKNEQEFNNEILKSSKYFKNSYSVVENRIDSIFYFTILETLSYLTSKKWDDAEMNIKKLGNILFKKEVSSFNFNDTDYQFVLYKILVSLQKICNQEPNLWLDFRLELSNIFRYFNELNTTFLEQRIQQNSIVNEFGEFIKLKIFEPYVISNLSSELIRLEKRIKELEKDSEEYNFLSYIISVIRQDDKKKIEKSNYKNQLIKIFPGYPQNDIDELAKVVESPEELLKTLKKFSKDNQQLLDALIFACSKLQGNKNYWGRRVEENDRNKQIANLLEARGFKVKDQSQWSISNKGINSGEIDVFIFNKNDTPMSIIEALNLDSLKKKYLNTHLDKLFKYDTTGLKNNFILIYSLAKNFDNLWIKYIAYIQEYDFIYNRIFFDEIYIYQFADIRICKTMHNRNNMKVNIYHIMINMIER